MTQKFMYLVNHFCTFPTSEYGGLWAVIAKNDDECFDLIVECDQDLNKRFYVNLRENVVNAQKFLLSNEYKSMVVEQFTT